MPYVVGELAPNSSHLAGVLVKYVPGRGFFRAVSSQNRDKFVTSPPPPQSLNGSLASINCSLFLLKTLILKKKKKKLIA